MLTFDLQLFAVSTPVGELSTLGVAKETVLNTFVAPTTFHELEAFSPAVKTTFINRMGSVGAPGMRPPATGPLDVSGSLRVAPVSDICTQLLAYAFGTQAAPSAAPTGVSINSSGGITGNGSPQAVTTAGNPIAAGFAVGNSVEIYTTSQGTEVVTISAISTSSMTINPVHTYTSAVQLLQLSTTAKTSKLSFGNLRQLPSFSMEYNIPTSGGFGECLDYTGNVIETAKLALASAKGLTIDYTFAGINQVKQSSPTAASFSTKGIYTMESAGSNVYLNSLLIGALANPPDIKSWDLTLANQLDKSRRSAGSGRYVNGWPLGQRKVTGTLKLGFESEAARLIFWGAATGPNATIAGVPLTLNIASQDLADSTNNLPYSISIVMPNIRMSQADVPHKTSGGLEQTVNFMATESVVGAGDDLSATLINTQTAVW